MSQLQVLEIVPGGGVSVFELPARAFIPLGSLSQLKALKIGTSFFPLCMSEEDDEDLDPLHRDDQFSTADASEMFSGLTALEHLSINALDYEGHDHHLWESISRFCPKLRSLEFVGKLDLWSFVLPTAPVLQNVTDMAIERVKSRMNVSQAVRIIDNFAPKLQRLRCTGERSASKEVCTTWAEFRSTQGYFKHEGRSRIEELAA